MKALIVHDVFKIARFTDAPCTVIGYNPTEFVNNERSCVRKGSQFPAREGTINGFLM
jgi:hypothetical protein